MCPSQLIHGFPSLAMATAAYGLTGYAVAMHGWRLLSRPNMRGAKNASYNLHHRPFVWTATADSILAKVQRLCKVINGTLH